MSQTALAVVPSGPHQHLRDKIKEAETGATEAALELIERLKTLGMEAESLVDLNILPTPAAEAFKRIATHIENFQTDVVGKLRRAEDPRRRG